MLLRSVPRLFAGLLVCLSVLLSVLLAGCSTAQGPASPASSRSASSGHGNPSAGSGTATPSWARGMATVRVSRLPSEARQTLALIDKGGPFPYTQDGVVFGNRERRLPRHERGYYHEYTVKTPGARTRGARRLITGQHAELYYTDDHYDTFRAVLR
ncbi:ribonuclease domain-containing protein [Streptomyces andamanensis]|uniref:Ribonuclease domain-containing protein n=1 Tax=Streptomyces andamanensis TaxID=1565035 RepID=A0ABV8T9I6_9ACTN